MPGSGVESQDDRMLRELRKAAGRTVTAMVDALALAGLPPLPSLSGGRVTIMEHGLHIEIGGCNIRTLQAIADHIEAHAGCMGRVIRGETVPTGLAELPPLYRELSAE